MASPELAELTGQIQGAIAVLKWGLSVIGSLLLLLLALVSYVFTKLETRVHKNATAITATTGRVIVLETWRGEHEKVHAKERA